MSKAVILAFAFGAPKTMAPNKRVAGKASYLSRYYYHNTAPIFTQKDVPVKSENIEVIFAENLVDKKYVSSFDIIRIFVKEAKKRKWEEVYLVAAPQHWHRCRRDLKKILAEENLKMKIFFDLSGWPWPKSVCYDENSTQWWTRSPSRWWPYEITLRLLPWRLYKIIVSNLREL